MINEKIKLIENNSSEKIFLKYVFTLEKIVPRLTKIIFLLSVFFFFCCFFSSFYQSKR